MLKETELRIVRALQTTDTPWWFIAKEWSVSRKTVERLARKYGVTKKPQDWKKLARGHA